MPEPSQSGSVSHGGESRIRRVSPEENVRLNIAALLAGQSDAAQQRGWNFACTYAASDAAIERAVRAWWAHESDSGVAWSDVIESVKNGYRARAREALAAVFWSGS